MKLSRCVDDNTGVSGRRSRGVGGRVSVTLHPGGRLEPNDPRVLGRTWSWRRRRRYGHLCRLCRPVGAGARRGHHVHGSATTCDRRNGVVRRRPGRLVAGQRRHGGTFQRRQEHGATTVWTSVDQRDHQSTTTTNHVHRPISASMGARRHGQEGHLPPSPYPSGNVVKCFCALVVTAKRPVVE